ncbi:MAG TPA: hypothetical protein VJB39_01270 [Patescibacteria group bacterium]|nr:hypothetical protein [Patescibacteria group bacterium]
MNIGRILFLALFLFSTSSVLAGASLVEKIYNEAMAGTVLTVDGDARQRLRLRDDYRRELLEVFGEFNEENLSYRQLEEKLLALSVPADFKDLHLNLVAAVAELEKDPQEAESKDRLERAKNNYAWLTGVLTLFITNNF